MAIFLSEAEVRSLLPIEEAIRALEPAFLQQSSGTGINSPRKRLESGSAGITMMVAVLGDQGVSGFKTQGAGRPLVLLFGSEPRSLLAVMEAAALGQIRTGAASGLATEVMARKDAKSVGVIGTGNQAITQLTAVCSVRQITQIKAFSRTQENRDKFCVDMSAMLGVSVESVSSANEAVRGVDIVIAITNVRTLSPVLLGEWLEPGMHINAAGANSMNRRELDDEAVTRSSLIVVDSKEQAKMECADLAIPVDLGLLEWDRVVELGRVVSGQVSGRSDPDDITLFESQGIALEDVAAATHIYNRAKQEGIGTTLPF